jgi:hypothetical protein
MPPRGCEEQHRWKPKKALTRMLATVPHIVGHASDDLESCCRSLLVTYSLPIQTIRTGNAHHCRRTLDARMGCTSRWRSRNCVGCGETPHMVETMQPRGRRRAKAGLMRRRARTSGFPSVGPVRAHCATDKRIMCPRRVLVILIVLRSQSAGDRSGTLYAASARPRPLSGAQKLLSNSRFIVR